MNKAFLPGLATVFATIFFAGCGNNSRQAAATTDSTSATAAATAETLPDTAAFHDTVDGRPTGLFILKNGLASAAITNYGARVVSLIVPDKNGTPTDVVLGYDSIGKYIHRPDTYFGAIVGRYGNRIAKGRFKLKDAVYKLPVNDGPNSLHGGKKGFDAVVWTGRQLNDHSVEMTYLSKDGDQGYPGNLKVRVTYTLTDSNSLEIGYEATTDKPTVLNLTNHSYFNLNGQGSGTINDHLMQIYADKFTPIDSTMIPTGKIEPVGGTPLDFRRPTAIGARVNDTANAQLRYGKGYDHNFVLSAAPAEIDGKKLSHAATVRADKSGIVLDVYTDQPGIQFYGGNFLKGADPLKGGKRDDYRSAFCLETQHFPDSPNEPAFPSTELHPGQTYQSITIYRFSAK